MAVLSKMETEKPLEFPAVCAHCQSDTDKYIYCHAGQTGLVQALGFFFHFVHVLELGNSVKVPLCDECRQRLSFSVWLGIFSTLFGVSLMILGAKLNHDWAWLLLSLGAFLFAIPLFCYEAVKETLIGIRVVKRGRSYVYYFSSDKYVKCLEENGTIPARTKEQAAKNKDMFDE